MEIGYLVPQLVLEKPLAHEVLQWLPPLNGTDCHNQSDDSTQQQVSEVNLKPICLDLLILHHSTSPWLPNLDFDLICPLTFPFLISSVLEDVVSILHYINVFWSILFYKLQAKYLKISRFIRIIDWLGPDKTAP